MARYKTEVGGEEWSWQEVEEMLDKLLPCNSQREFDKACDDFATKHNRGNRKIGLGKRHGDLVRRQFWGLVTGYKKCECPLPAMYQRTGCQISWAEREAIRWLTSQGSSFDDVVRTRLGLLLRRGPVELDDIINKYGPAHGRRGLGLV